MADILFSELAPRCRANGWMAIIPVHEKQKRPIPDGWPRYAQSPLTDAELAQYYAHKRRAGLGFAYGGSEQIIAVDLDFLDEATADEACAATRLRDSPRIRADGSHALHGAGQGAGLSGPSI